MLVKTGKLRLVNNHFKLFMPAKVRVDRLLTIDLHAVQIQVSLIFLLTHDGCIFDHGLFRTLDDWKKTYVVVSQTMVV